MDAEPSLNATTPVTTPTAAGPDSGRKTLEVRLGIVMYGGVALAIYIYGVAAELFRAVRGQGVFKLIKALTDSDVVVDVISGTSAGGINGILLGYALCNERDFTGVSSLWRKRAAIADMMHKTNADFRTCTSLLDSDGYYQDQLQQAFESLAGMETPLEVGDDPSEISELDLYVTGTDVEGNRYTQFDDAGHPVDVKDHRTVFLLKHRAGRKEPFDPTAPFTHEALAKLARITSCFPAAFAPVHVGADPSGKPSADATLCQWGRIGKSDSFFLDGGVLDNKPFTYTIEAIFSRTADRKVARKLLYIEPDPETFSGLGRPSCRPNIATAVLASLITIPGYESISEDLKLLAAHNSKLDEYQRLLKNLEERGAAAAPSDTADALWKRSRLVALSNRIVEGLLKKGGRNTLLSPTEREAAAEFVRTFDTFAATKVFELFAWFDVYYPLRRAERLVYLIYDLLDSNHRDDRTARAYARIRSAFNRQIRLYEIVRNAMEGLIDDAPFHWSADPGALLAELEGALRQLLNLTPQTALAMTPLNVPERYRGATERTRATDAVGDGEWLPQEQLTALNDALRDRATAIGAAITRHAALTVDPDFSCLLGRAAEYEAQVLAEANLPPDDPVRVAYERFADIDARLYPLELMGGLNEKDIIETVRVSPCDARRGFSRRPASDKLAGDALHHFGGFFKASWRSNDVLWGRLDGLCQLCEVLLSPQRLQSIGEHDELRRKVAQAIRQPALHAAALFPLAGPLTQARLQTWIEALVAENPAVRKRAREEDFQCHLDLLIEAAQLELLRPGMEEVVQDAVLEQSQWNQYLVTEAGNGHSGNGRAHAQAECASPNAGASSAADDSTETPNGVPAWSFRTGRGALDPLVAVTGAAQIAVNTLLRETRSDATADRPAHTPLGRFFTNHYEVGKETFSSSIPRLAILNVLTAALLVVRNCVLCMFGEEGASVRRNPFYLVFIELPLRLLRALVLLLTKAPGWGAGTLIVLGVMSAFALVVDGATGWVLTHRAEAQSPSAWRMIAFHYVPIAILIAEAALLVALQWVADRAPREPLLNTSKVARALAAGCGLFILVWTVVIAPVDGLPNGSRLPGIALELPHSVADVQAIPATLRSAVDAGLPIDSYAIIPVYVLVFGLLGWVLIRSGLWWIGVAVIGCVVGAAGFDELENYWQHQMLTVSLTPEIVSTVWWAASAKWTLLAFGMAFMSAAFLQRARPNPVIASLCLSSALLLVIGTRLCVPVTEWGFSLMGLALLCTGVLAPLGGERSATSTDARRRALHPNVLGPMATAGR